MERGWVAADDLEEDLRRSSLLSEGVEAAMSSWWETEGGGGGDGVVRDRGKVEEGVILLALL